MTDESLFLRGWGVGYQLEDGEIFKDFIILQGLRVAQAAVTERWP